MGRAMASVANEIALSTEPEVRLFVPSSEGGAFPPALYQYRYSDMAKRFPALTALHTFLGECVVRKRDSEEEREEAKRPDFAQHVCSRIETYDYGAARAELRDAVTRFRIEATPEREADFFLFRCMGRHLAAIYLHIEQFCNFRANYDPAVPFLEQNFGLARKSVPEGLQELVLEAEQATRGHFGEVDTEALLREKKLSFVLAYPDYAMAFIPEDGASRKFDVHSLEPVAYMLGGPAERYFKMLHNAVESKLGPLVESAYQLKGHALITSEQRAVTIQRAASGIRDAVSTIMAMPDLSDPNQYLPLRWFIQGPYNSKSYPEGLTVRGIAIYPGGETGSQSTLAIMSDLITGVRFAFKEDMLSKMEEIHRTTREESTIEFLDSLRAAAKVVTEISDAERQARAHLLFATNLYLLGHAIAYAKHVLAQQHSTVTLGNTPSKGKEDTATGGSPGGFLIKKVIERHEFLRTSPQLDATPLRGEIEQFDAQLAAVIAFTQGAHRDAEMDVGPLKALVDYSMEKAVSLPASAQLMPRKRPLGA